MSPPRLATLASGGLLKEVQDRPEHRYVRLQETEERRNELIGAALRQRVLQRWRGRPQSDPESLLEVRITLVGLDSADGA